MCVYVCVCVCVCVRSKQNAKKALEEKAALEKGRATAKVVYTRRVSKLSPKMLPNVAKY